MAKPPETPPHSDIDGVNRDGRISKPSRDQHPDPGASLKNADEQSAGRPNQSDSDR